VATVSALPRTAATGQVQRTLLVERVLAAGDAGASDAGASAGAGGHEGRR
jgi:hypothetical protein